jgi:hypothetical protein
LTFAGLSRRRAVAGHVAGPLGDGVDDLGAHVLERMIFRVASAASFLPSQAIATRRRGGSAGGFRTADPIVF